MASQEPAVFFVAILTRFEQLFEDAAARVSELFGPVSSASERFPFHWTDYYRKEMGPGLMRQYFTFGPFDEERLAEAKEATERIEKEFLYPHTSRRRVNLDPGVLTPGHLVLASHKASAHRVRLSRKVFAELELLYERGAYRPLPWTYADYRSEPALRYFGEARKLLAGRGRRFS